MKYTRSIRIKCMSCSSRNFYKIFAALVEIISLYTEIIAETDGRKVSIFFFIIIILPFV